MSFDLSKFLTEGLIDSVKNELIPTELATVYAGNYLAKSMITQTQVTQVSDAITAYKAAQAEATTTTSTTTVEPTTTTSTTTVEPTTTTSTTTTASK